MENLYLVVGLGNPGREYARTRHNAGFLVLDHLAAQWKADWAARKKFSVRMAESKRHGNRVVLCEPETFMNSSGESVGMLVSFHKLPPNRLLVIVDDADLPLG